MTRLHNPNSSEFTIFWMVGVQYYLATSCYKRIAMSVWLKPVSDVQCFVCKGSLEKNMVHLYYRVIEL